MVGQAKQRAVRRRAVGQFDGQGHLADWFVRPVCERLPDEIAVHPQLVHRVDHPRQVVRPDRQFPVPATDVVGARVQQRAAALHPQPDGLGGWQAVQGDRPLRSLDDVVVKGKIRLLRARHRGIDHGERDTGKAGRLGCHANVLCDTDHTARIPDDVHSRLLVQRVMEQRFQRAVLADPVSSPPRQQGIAPRRLAEIERLSKVGSRREDTERHVGQRLGAAAIFGRAGIERGGHLMEVLPQVSQPHQRPGGDAKLRTTTAQPPRQTVEPVVFSEGREAGFVQVAASIHDQGQKAWPGQTALHMPVECIQVTGQTPSDAQVFEVSEVEPPTKEPDAALVGVDVMRSLQIRAVVPDQLQWKRQRLFERGCVNVCMAAVCLESRHQVELGGPVSLKSAGQPGAAVCKKPGDVVFTQVSHVPCGQAPLQLRVFAVKPAFPKGIEGYAVCQAGEIQMPQVRADRRHGLESRRHAQVPVSLVRGSPC